MDITVKYDIWDIVQVEISDKWYKVVWYEYVECRWLRYICIDWWDYYKYFSEIEITKKVENNAIWISTWLSK